MKSQRFILKFIYFSFYVGSMVDARYFYDILQHKLLLALSCWKHLGCPPLHIFCLCSSWTQAVNYVHWSEVQTETSIVSSGILSPALRLSQHFISSNLLIEPMDYEHQSIISRFLALLPENLQQTPLSSHTKWRRRQGVGGYMDRMHRQRKSPCLSFDMYISNHFLNRIFFPSSHQMPLSFTRYSSPFYWGSVCVFTSPFYTHLM